MSIISALIAKARDRVWAKLSERTPSENAFLLLIPAVGVGVGLTSVAIAHIIAWLQRLAWGSGEHLAQASQSSTALQRVSILAVGGACVGALAWITRSTVGGHGTARIIQALALKGGHISLREIWSRILSGILTVSSGGSLGREGPMIQLAAAYGSHVGRRCNLTTQQLRILVCCAAASAIAAVYNAPIGGAIFALEILIGSFALEILGPVVVSSVISTLIFRSAMGDLPRFLIPQAYREAYRLISGWELFAYLGLGILGGIVSVIFIRVLFWSEDAFAKLPVSRYVKPVLGFALVGGIGIWLPQVFGNGYEATNLALNERLTWQLLLILPAAKLVATALTAGSGGSGGLFTPSLMIGALVGGGFGYGLHALFPQHTAEHGAYALVGMGAIVAGTTHAPLTAIMMIFEQTNSYQIILPLMFVCIISNVTARMFQRKSLYEEVLRRRGITLPKGPEASIMQNLRVKDLMHDDVLAVKESASFATVMDAFLKAPHNYLYVVVGDNRFYGAISLHSLKEMLREADSLDSVIAYDLADDKFTYVTQDQRLAEIMETFWRQHCERLPVVDDAQNRRLIGWISKRDLFGVYSQEILGKRQLLTRFSVTDDHGEHSSFVELPAGFQVHNVVVPAAMDGRSLAEVAARSSYGVHVLQITHRDPTTGHETVEMPGPASRLQAGDRLALIGTADGIARLEKAWTTTIEKPKL